MTMPFDPSVMSQGRSASTSPGRIAVPSSTSMMSRTWPSFFGPGRPGSLRQVAAAARIAAICSNDSACGVTLGLGSGEVPSTGLRLIASWRSANPNSRFSRVRDWRPREYETADCDLRNHSTRPVVTSASV
jgi:hypothetical protein